jgi:hypothetical protein
MEALRYLDNKDKCLFFSFIINGFNDTCYLEFNVFQLFHKSKSLVVVQLICSFVKQLLNKNTNKLD